MNKYQYERQLFFSLLLKMSLKGQISYKTLSLNKNSSYKLK